MSDDTKHPIDADEPVRRTDAFLAARKNDAAKTLPAELQPTGPPNEEWRNFIDSAGNIRTAGNLTKFTAIRRASSHVSRFGRRAVRRSDTSGIRGEAEARDLHLKRH